MKWNGNKNLFVQWMNRQQTNTICMLYEPGVSDGIIVSSIYFIAALYLAEVFSCLTDTKF